MRTLASLVSVNGLFRKNLSQIFLSKNSFFLFKSGKIFRIDAHCFENYFLVHEFFSFCATFNLWDVVDFSFVQFYMYAECQSTHTEQIIMQSAIHKIDHISKTKSRTIKTHELKNHFHINVLSSCKLGHFWTIYFLVGGTHDVSL